MHLALLFGRYARRLLWGDIVHAKGDGMDLIESMTIFVGVAEAEGFNRAAGKLGLSKSVVTRAIAQLEARLNVRLLQRTTRRVTLTDIGATYLNECREILEHIASTEANVSKSNAETKGELRIAVSTSFALERLPPFLKAYADLYPEVDLRLTLLDREIDIVDEGFDLAIVPERSIMSGTSIVRMLASYSNVAVASPIYVRAAQFLEDTPLSLERHVFIGRAIDAKGRSVTLAAGDDVHTIHLTPRFTANNLLMVQRMTMTGMGFSLLPQSLIERELVSGSLVRLLAHYAIAEDESNICIAYPSRKYIRAVARTFIDHILNWPPLVPSCPS
ncbi:LysR family transcriptional regulator [Caballeronia sordidicola]|uniref:LysR family transcriptional regulator n=1 Tax=Caballeronia sordidicola TaxID=196367 RepID=UPI00068F0BC5|nr:LysR family transcriptional regulator [Caballeronia sordidicola]